MKLWLLALAFLALCIGCGGSSTSSIPTSNVQPRVSVNIRVTVPSQLLSTNVRSVVVTFVPVGEVVPPPIPPLTIDVASGSNDCTIAAGTTTCGGSLSVPLGQQNFTITLYSDVGGKGAQLGVKSFTATITGAGQTIDISSASGTLQVVATLQLVINPPQLISGTAANVTVSVNAFDGSGKIITSPYNVPVTIVAPPTVSPGQPPILTAPPIVNGMGATVATGPDQFFTFAYSGTTVGLPPSLEFMANALSVPSVSAQLTFVLPTPPPTPTPSPTPTPVPTLAVLATPTPGPITVQPNVLLFEAALQPAQTFSAAEPGFTSLTATSANPAVATVTAAGTTFSVAPVGAGSTLITVSDGAGRTGTVAAYVNQTTVIIQDRRRSH